ncbi:hypothetical protein [Enterobacter kobei]|uniref:hypothetical protein n=1 Tax=Enterobacter kobei TaxID=208224 RepID=UPI0020215AF1|nr:hypothetical protein [Enterobacter kobei]MCM7497976.1 hypothetical protein [Enterobacter kobei]URG38818.1 hypothetical protein M8978_09260 [Enterobacter kobei]
MITSLLGVSSALIGAFGGAILANHFAEKRYLKQTQQDAEKEKKKLLISKTEELHILLSKWTKYISNIHLYRLSLLMNKINLHDYYTNVAALELESGLHDRIEALIFLYFPFFESDLLEVRKLLTASNNAEDRVLNHRMERDEAFKIIDDCGKKLEKKFLQMNKKLVSSIQL